MKTCRECGDLLEVGDNWTEGFKNARQYICNPCSARKYNERRRVLKQEAIDYLGGKCTDCGVSYEHQAVYDFHHIDPSLKTATPSDLIRGLKRDMIFKEIENCELLCSNCHRIRHANEHIGGAS